MKRVLSIFACLALLSSVSLGAQNYDNVINGLRKAEAASQDAKKGTQVNTWLTLGKKYLDAYLLPTKNIIEGTSRDNLVYMMPGEKVLSSENVEIEGTALTKDIYDNKDLYFDASGALVLVVVTKPVEEGLLDKALDAYLKAYELDVKKQKTDDILAQIAVIAKNYNNDALNAYRFKDYASSSVYFEKAYNAQIVPPVEKIDSSALINAGFTAHFAGDNERAVVMLEQSIATGIYGDNGGAFSTLADIYQSEGKADEARAVLEKGFISYPQSQAILVGLINNYITKGDNTDKLFNLLHEAQIQDPSNASLFYVEGNVNKELGEANEKMKDDYYKKAKACYDETIKVDPNYVYGYAGYALILYEEARQYDEKAQTEFDDTKYNALMASRDNALKNSCAYFEQAFDHTDDADLKSAIAQNIYQICFSLRSDSVYEEKYIKYKSIAEGQCQPNAAPSRPNTAPSRPNADAPTPIY